MPQPNVSGMDPPFGDAFRNCTFPDQALTSTDLLGNNSDPDFMYELDREMTYTHSSRDDSLTLGDCKDIDILEPLNELLDSDPSYTSNWEQWDTCWEDLTKYTKLTSYDIWGTKEVDFLGLDDFSSPYQNEEVISRTPTLAQLNCEDSQPVLDSLYHPDLLKSLNQNSLTSSLAGKKLSANRATPPVSSARSPCIDACLPETTQKVAKSVSSSATVDNSNRLQPLNTKIGSVHVDNKDFVKKAKVWINPAPLGKSTLGATQVHSDLPDDSCCSDIGAAVRKLEKTSAEGLYSNKTPTVFKEANDLYTPPETVEMVSPPVSDHTQKKEEHNYSLFVSDGLNEQSPSIEQEAEDDDDEEDDEDHDEGFGSEHEYSDNEEDEDDDEEEDKDDDVSDTFSEPGYENDTVEDVKDAVTGISRKRSKRRYFWEYSEQLIPPPKQDRMLKPSEWDRDTLPSNMYQKNGLHHGKLKELKSAVNDWLCLLKQSMSETQYLNSEKIQVQSSLLSSWLMCLNVLSTFLPDCTFFFSCSLSMDNSILHCQNREKGSTDPFK
uniref:CREB3 regulatory factor isoform X2 n=1 Tax=Pristiophorus japonicus TaxID=55135 RepID=UPI00398EAADA